MNHILSTEHIIGTPNLNVHVQCPFCRKERDVQVDANGFTLWQRGVLAQAALPVSTPSDREALMTGICDECFPSDEEDEQGEQPDPASLDIAEDAHIDNRIGDHIDGYDRDDLGESPDY